MKVFDRFVMCMDTVAVLPHAHKDSLHTHTMDKFTLSTVFYRQFRRGGVVKGSSMIAS